MWSWEHRPFVTGCHIRAMVVNRGDSLAVQPPIIQTALGSGKRQMFVGSIADQAVNPVSDKGAMTWR